MKTIDALDVLRGFVSSYPTQREAAVVFGISAAYLSDILNERRDVSETMLAKLGLKRVVTKA